MADLFDDLGYNPWFSMGAGILSESGRGVPTGQAVGRGILSGMQNMRRQEQVRQQADAARGLANWRAFQMEQARAEAEREQTAADLAAQRRERMAEFTGTIEDPQQRMFAEMYPQQYFETQARQQLEQFKQQQPITKIGEYNQALQRGEITPQEHADLVAKARRMPLDVDVGFDQQGNVAIVNAREGTVTRIAPGGAQQTLNLSGQPVVSPSAPRVGRAPPPRIGQPRTDVELTAPTEQPIQGDLPVQASLGEFEQQEWTRVFGTMPTEQQNKYTTANVAQTKIPGIMQQVRANPDAFGTMIGITSLAPEHMQEGSFIKAIDEYQTKDLTPEQQAARGAVFREASAIINDLAGAAVSGQEQKRIERFAPKPTDNMKQVLTKLEGAMRESGTWMSTLESQFGLPSRQRVQVPGQVDADWETQPDGTQIRIIED